MDIDLTSSNDLIGLYSLDAAFLYFQPNHELRLTWFVLSAPYEARRGGLFTDDAKGGAQGYLLLSLTLLGPGNTRALHLHTHPRSIVSHLKRSRPIPSTSHSIPSDPIPHRTTLHHHQCSLYPTSPPHCTQP